MNALRELAPAKINLALHVIRRLDNNYHELDSLVVFLEHGDTLEAELRDENRITLSIEGPFAEALGHTEENLVLRAANLLRVKSGAAQGVHLRLTKYIPVGAGLGGGSADAAAALRLLNRLWQTDYTLDALAEMAWEIGGDVPACVFGVPVRMQGVGERISPLSDFPSGDCVVVYPASPLWTADVYRNLRAEDFSGDMPAFPAIEGELPLWLTWLRETTNDLQRAAVDLNGAVANALELLKQQEGSRFIRMSGSGSACFALFDTTEQAENARANIAAKRPEYWVKRTRLAGIR